MAGLKSIAQVNYDQIYPNATSQTSVKVEHLIEEAKIRYAWELFRVGKESKRVDGEWEIPSDLWREALIDIVNNEADISELNVFRSLEGDSWVGNIGGIGSDCKYMRLTLNLSQSFDEDYLGNSKSYIVVGSKIKFPQGTHKKSLPIVYATNGNDLDDEIQIDDAIGALVSDYIYKKFSGRLPEDRTLNSNSNT